MADHAKHWMQRLQQQLDVGKLPLYQAVCMPGSHKAGNYKQTFGTKPGLDKIALTQSLSIFRQLEFGVRHLDIRLTLAAPEGKPASEATWNCGFYTKETGGFGWQGASCVPLEEVIDEINKFTKDNAEVIFVDISAPMRLTIQGHYESKASRLAPADEQDL